MGVVGIEPTLTDAQSRRDDDLSCLFHLGYTRQKLVNVGIEPTLVHQYFYQLLIH